MKRLLYLLALLFLVGGTASAQSAAKTAPKTKKNTPVIRPHTVANVAQSHVRANVPASSQFDRLLRRDLNAYFRRRTGKNVAVTYEMLRTGPTQTGVAYPKYYLWVALRNGKSLVEEGAVRVAAIGQKRFEVTIYLTRSAMTQKPERIKEVFPAAVSEKLAARLCLPSEAADACSE